MKTRTHYGYIRNGVPHCQSLRLAIAELDGCNVEFTVKKSGQGKRSNPQNDYIHWMFDFIAKALTDMTGDTYSPDEVKHWLKMELLTYEKHMPDGTSVPMVKGTSEMTKEEGTTFIDGYVRRLAKMGITVPLPGEQVRIAA